LVTTLLAFASSAWAEPNLTVTVDREEIFLGETVTLQISVSGTRRAGEPDLTELRDCTIVARGSSRQLTFVNGRRTEWIAYTVQATPTRIGDLSLGPIHVDADGVRLTTTGPSVKVRGAEQQDWVYIEVTPSRESVILDEMFHVDVSIGLRELPPPYDQHDPLDPSDPPHLDVPFLSAPAGLGAIPIEQLLQPHVVQRRDQPGFALNRVTFNVDPMMNFFNFGSMAEQEQARFLFPNQRVNSARGRYRVYNLRFTYVAKAEGAYTFGPVEFKGRPITEVGPGGQVGKRPIFTASPPVTVRVTPPPMQGRPASFVGTVGSNLVVTAALDTQTCSVGDPLSLTLDISGDIGLDSLSPPLLARQTDLTNRFRVYDDSVRTTSRERGRTYRYTVRPTQPGTYELPPIAISYYDSLAGAYRTVHTAPIPIRANESATVGGSMILTAATNSVTAMTIRAGTDASLFAPVTMNPAGARPAPLFRWPVHGGIGLFGPCVLALTLTVRSMRRLLHLRARHIRPRDARRVAHATLDRGEKEASMEQRGAAVRTALSTYLGTMLDAPAQGLAPTDVQNLLRSVPSVPADLSERCHTLHAQLFHAQFERDGKFEADSNTIAMARQIVDDLDACLRHHARQHRGGTLAVLLLSATTCLMGVGSAHAAPATDAAARFMWDRSNASLSAAQSAADFSAAAELYRELAQHGVRNGPLFYNQGVALMSAEHPREALQAFLRAERYLGARPEIQHNIGCALEALDGDRGVQLLPTQRIFLFWHYGLGFSVRLGLALGGFSLICVAAAMRALRWQTCASLALIVGACLLIALGTSVAVSLHAESIDDARLHDVRNAS
ncbi:MAG: BatD family protein, partial [Verrucomicrobia bacterium]|nr:BatD family protein [Verrucomicrobiota bacterium]